MFEDIFNVVAGEKLYACEAALDIADFYGIDISACYEADGSEETAKKNFWDKVKGGVTRVVEAVKTFCNFIKRKIKELFFKITKKDTFYMDPEEFKSYDATRGICEKILALADKGMAMARNAKEDASTDKVDSILAQINHLQKKNSEIRTARAGKTSNRWQVYNKPNCPDEQKMYAELTSLEKNAVEYETGAKTDVPKQFFTVVPQILRAKMDALRIYTRIVTRFASAPTSMPGKEDAAK